MSSLEMTDPAPTAAPAAVPGYALTEIIGRGASSTVWSARSEQTGDLVALKVTSPVLQDPQQVVDVAARERAILQRVSSDHIVRLHEALPLEDGSVALVLDLAAGGSLQDLVSIRGALDPGEVVTIFTPVATTLGELHAAGVVHADLSPGNILFTEAGKPVLSDFDAARLVGEQHPHMVSGTTGFVAPEVYRGGLPTEASDVWSLGALAWYAVTGGNPPPGNDVEAVAQATLGPAFAAVLTPMLAADPARRPAAARVAVGIYRASTPVPVRLAGRNPDPASAMTHRIRQEVAQESARLAEPRGTGRRLLTPRAKVGLVLLAAVLFTAGLLLVLAKVGSGPVVRPSGSSSNTATATPTASLSPAAQLRSDPQSVVQGLADARAAALMAGDPARLRDVHVEGSSAYAADVQSLAALTASGKRWADLVFHVRSAEMVRSDDKTAQVLAVIDRAVYAVIGPGTAREQVAAQEGHAFTYTLALTAAGWRITDISES